MIENVAIIILALLAQINVVPAETRTSHFLNQFVKTDKVIRHAENNNWDVYRDILKEEEPINPLPYKISNDEIVVNSSSAVAFDVGTDYILYSKNIEEKLPIASLTKIITALIVIEENNLNDVAIVSQSSFEVQGKKEGLSVGERIVVNDLLKMMLVSSNNIAASALAEHTGGNIENFVELMNQKANSLGLKNTKFYNPTGLDQEDINVSTAYDIAQLVDYALEESIIWEYTSMTDITVNSLDGKISHRVKNTNQLLGKLENVIGGKTGFTDMAGECLVLITSNGDEKNNRTITVVLNAEDRFQETKKLVNWIYESYSW